MKLFLFVFLTFVSIAGALATSNTKRPHLYQPNEIQTVLTCDAGSADYQAKDYYTLGYIIDSKDAGILMFANFDSGMEVLDLQRDFASEESAQFSDSFLKYSLSIPAKNLVLMNVEGVIVDTIPCH